MTNDQCPMTKEAPITKHQAPEKSQAPSTRIMDWSVRVGRLPSADLKVGNTASFETCGTNRE
jgi:hypothetical protein